MTVDPKITFVLGILVTIAVGIGGGAVQLTHAIPADYIPVVQAWNNIIGFVGTAVLTALTGISSAKTGPLTK